MRLRDPKQIIQAIALEQSEGVTHKLMFRMAQKEYRVIVFDRNKELICRGQGATESEAWTDAMQAYKTTPKKKDKAELADENESLRARLADLEPGVEDATSSDDAATTNDDSPAPGEDAPAPVKKRKKKAARKVAPMDLPPENLSGPFR